MKKTLPIILRWTVVILLISIYIKLLSVNWTEVPVKSIEEQSRNATLHGEAPLYEFPNIKELEFILATKNNINTPTINRKQYWKEFREPLDGWGIAVPVDWMIETQY